MKPRSVDAIVREIFLECQVCENEEIVLFWYFENTPKFILLFERHVTYLLVFKIMI